MMTRTQTLRPHDKGRCAAPRERRGALSTLLPVAVLASAILASPASADVFNVEIDWMRVPGDHDHQPGALEIQAVQQMFACQGHQLNIELGNEVPHYQVLMRHPDSVAVFFAYAAVDSSFGRIKQNHFGHAGQAGWHYCLFAHQYQGTDYQPSGSSGLGEQPGDDFIVTMGAFSGQVGTAFDRAATLAHELGHNLGLAHCGTGNCDDASQPGWIGPYQENFPSLMSYFYQLGGVRTNLVCQGLIGQDESALWRELDYSHGRMCVLTEAALDETYGLGIVPVDWDCNGSVQGVVVKDLNGDASGWCGSTSGLQVLWDRDEWNLISDFTFSGANLAHMPTVECITAEEADQRDASCPQPQLTVEPCVAGLTVYARPGAGGPFTGRCTEPFPQLLWAYNNAPSGSLLVLAPGTYQESGTVSLTRPMRIVCPSSALISPP